MSSKYKDFRSISNEAITMLERLGASDKVAELRKAYEAAVLTGGVIVPELAGDKGQKLPPHCIVERRIVANLIAHMLAAGWLLHSVNDGEAVTGCATMSEAMELCFAVDEASLRFWKPLKREVRGATEEQLIDQYNGDLKHCHGVLLIFGNGNNGLDVISDWNYSDGDRDGFNKLMGAFDTEKFA